MIFWIENTITGKTKQYDFETDRIIYSDKK